MATEDVTWSPQAEVALQQVPEFALETARANTENFVREKRQSVVTLELWQEALAKSGRFGGGGPPGAAQATMNQDNGGFREGHDG